MTRRSLYLSFIFADIRMILDLHTHSVKSDDGRAKVENYCKWIQKKELPLDGFVLTEHRQFDDQSDSIAFHIYPFSNKCAAPHIVVRAGLRISCHCLYFMSDQE